MTSGQLTARLLRRNISAGRVAGFAISNFIGLLIVCGVLQIYVDARPLLGDEEGFINSDYLVINKYVGSMLQDGESTLFTESEIEELRSMPWVRRVGEFRASDYHVGASVNTGGRGMRTALFFESVPDGFVDVPRARWQWKPGDREVPIIISRDYLTLYNFGFAGAAGLPRLSEGMVSGIPLDLYLRSDSGAGAMTLRGRVVGYSDRINTILVPRAFIDETNRLLGSRSAGRPSRLIVDVSRPGDAAIREYLESHGLEVAGDKSASQATSLLRTVVAVVMGVGLLVTLLSAVILLLSLSLLMEKNRDKLHTLLMLGVPPATVGHPFRQVVATGCIVALGATVASLAGLRALYMPALEGGSPGNGILWGAGCALLLSAAVCAGNLLAVRRRVLRAWGRHG